MTEIYKTEEQNLGEYIEDLENWHKVRYLCRNPDALRTGGEQIEYALMCEEYKKLETGRGIL